MKQDKQEAAVLQDTGAESPFQSYCHTDLAVEMKEQAEQLQELAEEGVLLDGVEVVTKRYRYHGIEETQIKIVDECGEQALGKPMGQYVTLEIHKLYEPCVQHKLAEILKEVLDKLCPKAQHLLMVGLGNRSVTPDAVGPMVVEQLDVTRHLYEHGLLNAKGTCKNVAAIAPGVMAQTGMETVEIVKGLVAELEPDVVIVIDALAARSSNRLNRTIQLCDTGIHPGAGVGNNRQRMDAHTLGVKVVAIGVPTVIAVPTIISDAMQQLLQLLGEKHAGKMVGELSYEEQYRLAEELVKPYFSDMFVTPKNIDEEMETVSACIAKGLNAYIGI